MPWPSGGISTANLDSGGDSPGLARPALLAAVQAVNDIAGSRAAINGIASLDGSGLVPAAQIPQIMPTGISLPYFGSTAPAGWVLASGRTIGSAASGASERANADTQALFTLLWNSMADTEAPVSGGRGASAAADFAANKTITLPDARGRTLAGLENMGGGTGASRSQFMTTGTLTSGSASVATGGTLRGSVTIGMSVFGPGIPAGTTVLSIGISSGITISNNATTSGAVTLRFGFMDTQALGSAGGRFIHSLTTNEMPSHTHQQTGNTGQATSAGSFQIAGNLSTVAINNTQSTGGDQAHSNLQPTLIAAYIIKL